MDIKGALKHCLILEEYYTDESYELSAFLREQQAEIDQLKADRLGMSEALMMQVEQANYCVECDQWASHGIEHKPDCTVLKAEQIIKQFETK